MKYTVIKNADVQQYLTDEEKVQLESIMDSIVIGRQRDNKFASNRYLVTNLDDAILANKVTEAFRYAGIEPFDFSDAKEGDLRVVAITNIGNPPMYLPVNSTEEAIALIDHFANKQLEDERIHSNMFGLEIYGDFGEGLQWTEWYDVVTGLDIVDLLDEAHGDTDLEDDDFF